MRAQVAAERMSARYLDPAILRGLVRPALSSPPRQTIHVPRPLHDYAPGERIEISSSSADQHLRTLTVSARWATVVSWDRASGELVVEPDER
jgi:hypothetical protein